MMEPYATTSTLLRPRQAKMHPLPVVQAVDSSDYESDEGASPSVSDSDATSVSSRSSSPGALKIVCQPLSTPRKKANVTNNTAHSSQVGVPSVRQSRKKNIQTSNDIGNQKGQKTLAAAATPSKNTKQQQTTVKTPRKRKRVEGSPSSAKRGRPVPSASSTPKNSIESKRQRLKMSQRRRTKSERNSRAGKAAGPSALVEETVVLDEEIDKFLEDKAMKNNLTATNVKSIIRHVITNNMVQKMVMSTVKTKTGNPDDSSDEEAYFEPKLTRARTKLLLEKQTSPLWPIVVSPVKAMKKPMSETQALIHEELPDDSSGDEEYLPRGDETHSDDENSSVASHASDAGSPRVSTPVSCTRSREALNRAVGTPTDKSSLFKTPPPLKPKCVRRLNDSAIGRRTRSKLPLNDTALEDLEMQLIPPDITPDMYDWGLSDNEDYLAFVKEFLCPGNSSVNEAGDDEEADPEYNVMEDEEEHDKEELRRDRAVKVSKKELNELVAELLEEAHFSSGDELDETDYSTFCASQVSMSCQSGVHEFVDFESSQDLNTKATNTPPVSKVTEEGLPIPTAAVASTSKQQPQHPAAAETCIVELKVVNSLHNGAEVLVETESPVVKTIISETIVEESAPFEEVATVEEEPLQQVLPAEPEALFSESAIANIQHQMRQHIQLLAQTYVMTASIYEPYFKTLARSTKRLIVEINNFAIANGDNSNFRVSNLDPAWQVVNSWPHKSSARTPIKKKILEEKYITDYQTERTDESYQQPLNFFPRHLVKVIAESPAFCYPELLPVYPNQNVCTNKSCFTTSEDLLLICGLEELRDTEMKLHSKTKLLSQILLTVKTPLMIYHRIRNLRKTAMKHRSVSSAATLYFESGIVPAGAEARVFAPFIPVPPIAQPREMLSNLWNALISKLGFLSELNWKLECETNSGSKTRKVKKNPIPSQSQTSKSKNNFFVVTSTFPPGTEMVQQKIAERPDLTAVPLLNMNGDPGAYMFIPNYAMPPPGYNTSPTGTEARKWYHPVPVHNPKLELSADSSTNEEDGPVLSFTPVGKPFRLDGIDSDVINLASLNTPLKKAIMQHAQESTPKKVCAREEQSARTCGNYLRNSSNNCEDRSLESDSSDDGSTADFIGGEEDVNLTEYEENCGFESSASPAGMIVTLEINDESEAEADRVDTAPNNLEVQEAGENGQSQTRDNLNSSRGKKTESSHRTEESTNKSTERKKSATGTGGHDDDDEDDKIPPSKRTLPEDANEDAEREEDTEDEPEVAHSSKSKQTVPAKNLSRTPRNPKKHKRNPGLSPPKKRIPKTTPVEKMLEEDKQRDEEVCDAFMHAFLLKVQTVTESRNPGLHNEFIKLVSDAESGVDLLPKVQSLLKDYPEIVAEFTAFVDIDKSASVEDPNFSDYQDMQAELNFVRHLEKFAENSPQLKAKILHKFKILKEEPDLSEKDVADGLAPFFQGNLVMMDAFKALFPSIYRPEFLSDANDFEEVDMEVDDPTGQDDSNLELVKLPEEKNVPATSTCACQCHETSTHAYASRVKHCNKCCIKFQDGKVFVHNGRVIRPVNVELKSPTSARKILSGNSCRNCIQEPNKTKESPTTKYKDEVLVSKTKLEDIEALTSTGEDDDIEDGEIVDEDADEIEQQKVNPVTTIEKPSEEKGCETKVSLMPSMPWKMEEDRLILTTCQSEPTLEDAFTRLTSILPQRDITEIESRCVELISLLQQSITSSEDSGGT